MTASTLAVLRVLADDPTLHRYGLEIAREARVASGTLYPILDRLEDAGWIEGFWEEADPAAVGRPRRRYYTLTGEGARAASAALRDAHKRLTPRWLLPVPPDGVR